MRTISLIAGLTPCLFFAATTPAAGGQTAPAAAVPACDAAGLDFPYAPVESWVYPAIWRLYGLGFADNVFLSMRPWTKLSISRMLDRARVLIDDAPDGPAAEEAEGIYQAVLHEISPDISGPCGPYHGRAGIETVYTNLRGITGTPLRDSFHLGQTIINDYGRPYEGGFNSYSGASGYVAAGRFLVYARGEFEHAGSAPGYSTALAEALSAQDTVTFINPATGLPFNQATIPLGPIAAVNSGQWLEAYVSTRLLDHEISFGRTDDWLGPGMGGAMAYSDNAQDIYSFRINRVEPLSIPGLSYLPLGGRRISFLGPFRYDFLVGSLKGHTSPNDPWLHVEKLSFRPTRDFELGFERSVIWGGKDHVPITLHSFLRSFFSITAPDAAVKNSRDDPGARFASFDFSYRLPPRGWLTVYADGEVHDDISPIDAPRRASWRPGIYLARVPGIPKLDLRMEAATTDPPTGTSQGGHFMYWEGVQKQGYTNKGMLLGDWMGREGKGGQAWITYHLSGNEWIQVAARNQKVAMDFIAGGTTLNDLTFQTVKRIGPDFEVNGSFAYEQWKAPIYNSGVPVYPAPLHTVTTTTVQLTWYPERRVSF